MVDDSREFKAFLATSCPGTLVFDFDGVLTYTEDLHWSIFRDALREMTGDEYPFSDHWEVTGFDYDAIWKHLGERYGFSPNDSKAVAIREGLRALSVADELIGRGRSCYRYVRECIQIATENRWRIGCLTGNDMDTASRMLCAWGLERRFSFVYTVSPMKDSKADVLSAVSMLSDGDGRTVMLEDSPGNIMAMKEGMPELVVVGIGHPQSMGRLEQMEQCDYLIDVRDECSAFLDEQ